MSDHQRALYVLVVGGTMEKKKDSNWMLPLMWKVGGGALSQSQHDACEQEQEQGLKRGEFCSCTCTCNQLGNLGEEQHPGKEHLEGREAE